MNEVFHQTSAAGRWAVPPGARLGVVSAEGYALQQATPQDLANCIVAVGAHRDREALAALFRYFGPKLKTYFLRGGSTAGAAEDLVQETMLTLWRKAATFDPGKAGAATWIFTVARNLRIDHLRRQRNPADFPADVEDMPPTIEVELLAAERDMRIRDALASLSAEQQMIIRLSYYSDKSQSEIAGELGIPLGTVKSRTRLAMNRLRDLLDDDK